MDMREIVDKLNEYAYRYYTLDDPQISDAEYDKLYDELVKMEEETGTVLDDSPTKRVGGQILNGFKKHRHIEPLWSLDKAQSIDAVDEWMLRTDKLAEKEGLGKPSYSLEYKFDGLTINLTYENGVLVCGSTRGDGEIGEDVTEAIKTIKTIPLSIPYKGRVEIQGEAIMKLSVLEEYNRNSDEPLKNARNAAAGAIRNLDISETAKKKLSAYIYNVGYIEGLEFRSHGEMISFLKENLFCVSDYEKEFSNLDELMDSIREVEEGGRDKLDFLIDGMVIKITDMETRRRLGYTQKFPRWAIAYKFPAIEKTTRVLNVVWDVGRTGKLTPVAILEPVDIGGVTVKRATLNNFEDIKRKNVAIGSKVFIRRSNDVIPEILSATPLQDSNLIEIKRPEICPSCGSKLVSIGPNMYCLNSLDCKPQLISRIDHFASRDAMNIEGLSRSTVDQIVNCLGISNIADLYSIKKDDFLSLEGFAEKKAEKLINAIDNSKMPQLGNFIFALGIPNVGKKTARDLANEFCTFDALKNASIEDLLKISDIGDIVASSIVDFFANKHYEDIINRLFALGVCPMENERMSGEKPFDGLTFVVTGTLSKRNRKEVEDLIENLGGKASSSVSKKTDYVLAGENAGSKLSKAMALSVKIIDENAFEEMISPFM